MAIDIILLPTSSTSLKVDGIQQEGGLHSKININTRFENALHSSSKAIGPVAIIGGTASIYSAALSHSSSTLTPISVFYLVLLALNYSIMPRMSRKYVHPKTNKKSLALIEEIVKLFMGIIGFLITSNIQSIKKWTVRSSLIAAGLPSMLYAIKGVFTYTAYQNLDSVSFNGLSQTKTLSAALCCYLVLGKVQSQMQMIALGVLSVTPFVFQGDDKQWTNPIRWKRNTSTNQNSTHLNLTTEGNIENRRRFVFGVVPCLGATLLSGLAGAFSQRSLQTVVGSIERNAYFYSVEISFFTAICLVVSMLSERIKGLQNPVSSSGDVDVNADEGFFEYWSCETFIPIALKAGGGILTALVHKHSGSVLKSFSLVLGLIFSALLQAIFDGDDLSMGQIFGTMMVLLSSWLHFTSPPAP